MRVFHDFKNEIIDNKNVSGKEDWKVFSAFIRIEALETIESWLLPREVFVRWQIRDILNRASDFQELFHYCRENNINLYRNTRLHMKAIWDGEQSLFFGSANITARGLGLVEPSNIELNGFTDQLTLADRAFLNGVIQKSQLVTDELFEKLKAQVDALPKPPEPTEPPSLPETEIDYFLISQLPMTDSPQLFVDMYLGREEGDEQQQSCCAHDWALYEVPNGLEEQALKNHLKTRFNDHPFIQAFKQVVRDRVDNYGRPERDNSMRFGAVKEWFQQNTTTVPIPRRWELNEYISVLYDWIVFFDQNYSWNVPGRRAQVIRFDPK